MERGGEDAGADRERCLVFLAGVLRSSREALRASRSGKQDRRGVVCALYFAAMLQDAGAIWRLLREGCAFSVPKLLRAVIEDAATVGNVESDENYVEYLAFEALYKKVRHFRKARELMDSPESAGPCRVRRSDLRRLENALQTFSAKWKKPLNFEEKFRRAGMERLYALYYSLLCDDAHGAFFDVVSRYASGDPEAPARPVAATWVEVTAAALVFGAEHLLRASARDAGTVVPDMRRRLLQFHREFFPGRHVAA